MKKSESLHSKSYPQVSCLHDSFDEYESLLCGQHYREGNRPGEIKLPPDRQLLIPKENKKHEFING